MESSAIEETLSQVFHPRLVEAQRCKYASSFVLNKIAGWHGNWLWTGNQHQRISHRSLDNRSGIWSLWFLRFGEVSIWGRQSIFAHLSRGLKLKGSGSYIALQGGMWLKFRIQGKKNVCWGNNPKLWMILLWPSGNLRICLNLKY